MSVHDGDGAFYEQLIGSDADGFAQALAAAGIGIWYVDIDEDVQHYNAYLRGELGFGEGEQLSRVGAFERLLPPEDVEPAMARADEELSHGASAGLRIRVLHGDGRYRTCVTHGVPIYDDGGALARIIGIVRSQDELERAKHGMREAELIAGLGHWSVDLETGELYWSEGAYHIYGHEPGEIEPTIEYARSRYVDGERERFEEVVAEALAGSGRFEFRSRIAAHDGSERHVKLIGEVERDADGKPVAHSGVIQDITEEVVQEAQIRRAQKIEALGNMTGGAAHDFNNVLAVILGNLELLRAEVGRDDLVEYCDTAIAAALNGADTTRAMLSFARNAPLDPTMVNLNEIVGGLARWTGRTLPDNIETTVVLSDDLWTTGLDVASTEGALLNLVLNARDAMPAGGRLTIETANVDIEDGDLDGWGDGLEAGQYVMLSVGDTGLGVEADAVDQIFEPFYTTKATGEGTGLGLSMVEGFVKQSSGAIRVTTEQGAGTTLELFFPARAGDPASPVRPAGVSEGVTGNARLLVTEDEELVRTVLVETLTQAGYEVTAAAHGEAARDIFLADPTFDLLLTDIAMPGPMQGTGLAAALRTVRPSLPVILLSGYADDANVRAEGLVGQNVTRLTKPVRLADLLRAIETALAGG